jgi:hypothetical protein
MTFGDPKRLNTLMFQRERLEDELDKIQTYRSGTEKERQILDELREIEREINRFSVRSAIRAEKETTKYVYIYDDDKTFHAFDKDIDAAYEKAKKKMKKLKKDQEVEADKEVTMDFKVQDVDILSRIIKKAMAPTPGEGPLEYALRLIKTGLSNRYSLATEIRDNFAHMLSGWEALEIAEQALAAPMTASLSDLKDLIDVQTSDGNWNYDPYMHGMANGMLLAEGVVEDPSREIEFLEAPDQWLRDKQ